MVLEDVARHVHACKGCPRLSHRINHSLLLFAGASSWQAQMQVRALMFRLCHVRTRLAPSFFPSPCVIPLISVQLPETCRTGKRESGVLSVRSSTCPAVAPCHTAARR